MLKIKLNDYRKGYLAGWIAGGGGAIVGMIIADRL
jgi:hypothetical protein